MTAIELIRRIQSGQDVRGAEAGLYLLVREALLPRIRARMSKRLRIRMDPEDVLHEAFLKALKSIDTFRGSSDRDFFAWVDSIARNLSTDVEKRRSAAMVHFVRGENERGPRESQILSRKENTRQLREQEFIESLLKQLREKEAEIIRLKGLEGLSFKEIAAFWGKKSGAVQRFHLRALGRFRALAHLKARP